MPSCRNIENYSTEVHRGGRFEPVKLAGEPVSSPSKPPSLKSAPRPLPVRHSLLTLVGRNRPWTEISFPHKSPLVRAYGSRAQGHGFSNLLTRQRSSLSCERGHAASLLTPRSKKKRSQFYEHLIVSLQYNGGFLPFIILLTLFNYHHWGTRLNPISTFRPGS